MLRSKAAQFFTLEQKAKGLEQLCALLEQHIGLREMTITDPPGSNGGHRPYLASVPKEYWPIIAHALRQELATLDRQMVATGIVKDAG